MIKKGNKTIRITLDPETNELLNSLVNSYCKTKSEIIKVALRILAKSGKKPHYITIGFFEPNPISKPKNSASNERVKPTSNSPEELQETIRIAKTPWLDTEYDD